MPWRYCSLSPGDPADGWRAELQARIPDLHVRIWPEVGDPAAIEVALVWRPPPGELRATPISGPFCRSGPASTA